VIGAGLSAIAMALTQVLTPGPPTADYESASGLAREGLTLVLLLFSIAAVLVSRRLGDLPGRGPLLVAVGYGLLVVGVAAGLALREDPEWFAVLGLPGNLLASIGFIVAALAGWRSRRIPGWAALLLGVGGFVAILGAELGTTVLVGCYWLWYARWMHREVTGAAIAAGPAVTGSTRTA
jgi:peptidoglycan/LPS O-acetylase OafA/YrhL